MMTLEMVLVAIFGVVSGLALGWFVLRGRAIALARVAAAEMKASMQLEVATLTEKGNAANAALQAERLQHGTLRTVAERWRTALDQASNDIAKLTERSGRVPALEGEVANLKNALEFRDTELLRISAVNGQNSERSTQLAQQLSVSHTLTSELQKKLADADVSLGTANQAKAGFEQLARRVPGLEQQLADARGQLSCAKDEMTALRESSAGEVSRLVAEVSAERDAHTLLRQEATRTRSARESAEGQVATLTAELTQLRTRTDDERLHATEKLELLLAAKEALTDQFKSLAADILEDKSRRFAEQNQTTIGQLLEPLKAQLTDFKGKVEEVYHQEGKDRSALSEQVKQLVSLNHTLSQDAKNLTLALKGQAKTQGAWGELILERVLEASGLRKGHEYKVQDSQTREDGSRAQPDVIIELPGDRKLVVDAKVSLVAYDRFLSAATDEERSIALRQHLDSVRAHIKGLSEKRYHQLYGLQSLDFVLAFVPVEPAFMMAVTHDNELFMDAWQRNVLLVSPSTLLFVVRTVAHLWRQESQSRNAQDIAKRGGELYDKLCGFVMDLQKVGERLAQAKSAFDDAHGKLVLGRGNVIRQAEMLRELGVKPTKSLPPLLVETACIAEDIGATTYANSKAPTAVAVRDVDVVLAAH